MAAWRQFFSFFSFFVWWDANVSGAFPLVSEYSAGVGWGASLRTILTTTTTTT